MKNRSHVVTLMAAIAFAFVVIAAVAPAALAGRSEVYFSDVNGNPKTEWKVGEVLYVTLISHDENRDSDEVELIDRRSRCRTHTGVNVPCLEIWDPNTKDSETNQGKIVLVETGINTGIFRSQGIAVLPVEADPGYQENGSLEVFAGDTLMVRYQSPSDDNDIDLDQAKVSSTASVVHITNQAGQEVPLWQVGQQVWITVEDPDQNVDPLKPDTIKGVALWNPRCVWDVLERAGQPRTDQPEPKPCGAPVGFDDRLNAQFPDKFAPSLTLVETGPDTGVFRNVNGITLTDQLGPVREFRSVATALSLFVNHKDTIVAFYRLPTLVGTAAPQPPQPPTVETRTDTCPGSPLFECSRTVPVRVAAGQTFNVNFTITAKQDLKLVAIREQAPSGFRFGQVVATPTPQNVGTDGALRAAWDGNIAAGQTITLTYELTAGPTPGTYKIRGFVTSAPFTIVPLVSEIAVSPAAAGLGTTTGAGVSAQAESAQLSVTRQAPSQANVGQPFTVKLSVTAKQALPAVSVKENFDGLTLVDQGADFIGLEGTTLRGLMIQPAAGTMQTFTYQLSCPSEGTFTITGTAESKGVAAVTETSQITCGAGGGPIVPPGAVRFHRGAAGTNDPQDFALAQAKVGHLNPAKLQFTDINGNELNEVPLGTEFFITLIDDDQNVDSDHVETLCVQVFDVNGGREGDTPGSQRSFSPLLKNEPGACLEDHVRDLFMWKTGVQLVETGTNTGVFRNPNALKLIPICDRPETSPSEEPFTTKPSDTDNVQIHQLNWWQKVEPRTALKECYSGTPFLKEGRSEFTLDPTAAVEDVPDLIAAHAGDVVYVAFQDQLVDPFDVVYATTRVTDFQSIDQIQFVDENGSPVDTYKIGQDVFVKLRDENRNVSSDVVDKVVVLFLDRNSGDWENVILEETGADTGEFMNRAGLSLQPATSPGAVKVNDNRLEMFDRDTIEAHYQDNFNPKDYAAAWIRLVPQPEPGPGPISPAPKSQTRFSDAAGQPVADYAVGDTVYVKVTDASQNVSSSAADTIFGAITVTNTRTGEFVIVDATETGPDTGTFLSDPITTGAPGSGADLEVEENDVLEAVYVDPSDPTDTSKATITIVTRVFACTGAKNFPNPFTVTTTFEALGSGIAQISVAVYSLAGQQLAQLSAAGAQVTWDGRTETGESLGSGVYLYQVTCSGRAGESETSGVQKLVILK